MGKVIAECTCKMCGKTFEFIGFRKSSEARSYREWAERNITICDACGKKLKEEAREEENRMAAASAVERGWPELTGSEKQVKWANTIREQGLSESMKKIKNATSWLTSPEADADPERAEKKRRSLERYEHAVEIVLQETRASWWIDNRNNIKRHVSDTYEKVKSDPDFYRLTISQAEAEREAKDDPATIAEPTERKHDGIVDIKVENKRVCAFYQKDDDFRSTVKKLRFWWDSEERAWTLSIGVTTGTAAERAAELGNKLLNEGFAIRIQNPDTLRAAIEGRYEPVTTRWILRRSDDTLAIIWSREDDLYYEAKRLPRAKYVSSEVRVPSTEYKALLDFVKTYDFKIAPLAKELIDEMQRETVKVVPAEEKKAVYNEHPVEEILKSSRDVLADLIDD